LRNVIKLLIVLASVAIPPASANDATDESGALHQGRHLLELGYTSVDGFDGDIDVYATSYTYSYSHKLRFTGTTQWVELKSEGAEDIDGFRSSGLGDSMLTIQYDPGANLTSHPWLPDSLGVYAAALLPTGDSRDGLSGDAWGASIGAGWPLPMSSKFLIVPSMGYTRTFNHDSDAIELEEFGLGASFLWLSPLGFWLGVDPYINWDLENNEAIDEISLVLGKAFPNGLGVDLRWGTRRRFENFAKRDDEVLLLNFSWQFGSPPRD
jgi:hypothetical protein